VTTPRVALVTAATSGIGLGIAKALLDDGSLVVVSGRDSEKGRRVAEEIGAAAFVQAEATSQSDTEALVDTVLARHGRLDILVNNAGGSSGFAPVHALTDEAWAQALAWNVSSAFWAVRRALPGMVAAGFGRIINLGSVQGKQVNRPNAVHYVTAKHALNGFTKAVAFEYGRQGVTCNAICVGAVETDLMRQAGPEAAETAGMTYEQYKDRYAAAAATGRLTTVEEVAAMARLLASAEGAGISGAILNVDGGTCPY
jgi:NAD(P)-dependent dehydrogenase (short-subunit alcohol dehydrogenase family)